jgi:tetratricopeptide (TPR) repeat protein
MKSSVPAVLSALFLSMPVGATVPRDSSAGQEYVRARAAALYATPDEAARRFADVLKTAPTDRATALRLYRQAMLAGDRALAEQAASVFVRDGEVPPDIEWQLLSQAVAAHDWKTAQAWSDRIAGDRAFGFAGPVLQAWLALAQGNRDPLALLQAGTAKSVDTPYVDEHRAWLLLALGNKADGVPAIRALADARGGRSTRLQIGAAARLLELKDAPAALAMLAGDNAALIRAREIVASGRPLPGAVTGAASGIAELLIRIAADVGRTEANPIALGLARIATELDPGNAETWLVTADLLGGLGQPGLAIAALDKVSAGDPLAPAAQASRIQMLSRDGRRDAALAEAEAAAAKPDAAITDHLLVGDLLAAMDRSREAADAYGRGLAIAQAAQPPRADLWTIYLMRGGAYEQAGDWARAKPDLEKAASLAPDQPVALNYLGYAQLDRGENVAAAMKLVEKASALDPQNAAITDSLGWAYYLTGNLPAAIDRLEAAAASEPADPAINEHLGDAYWRAGRHVDARYAWRAALLYAEGGIAERLRGKIDLGPGTDATAAR